MKKPRKNSPRVSAAIQAYQGTDTKQKTKAPEKNRELTSKFSRREQSKKMPITPTGSKRPTGPLVRTARPMHTDAGMIQPGAFLEKLCQNRKRVRRVRASSRASGLAKWAEAVNIDALARMRPARRPVRALNIRPPSS